MSGKGFFYPSEHQRLKDDQTGAVIHQLTQHPSINHNLYFLNSSFTPDGETVVFTSYRDGNPNLFELAFPNGRIQQLTEGPQLHPFSACLSWSGEEIYFTRNGAVWKLTRASLEETCLAVFQASQLGECNLSHCGKWIVAAIKQEGNSGIVVAATDGSCHKLVLRWPRTVIHPQFHPLDNQLIEFSSDPAPRMHLLDLRTGKVECLYEHDNDEFVVHETFLGMTQDLVFTVWPFSLRRLHMASREVRDIAAFNAWHISPSADGTRILCDTNHPDIGIEIVEVATGARRTVCYSRSSNGGSQWRTSRYAVAEDWARAAEQQVERSQSLSWMKMKTDTVYGPQWTHPHPSWSPDETQVIYTSDVTGTAQVYVVEIPG